MTLALDGIHITSLALNLPGPAALLRCAQAGAACSKWEPPAGDPMAAYSPAAYVALHAGIAVQRADLKSDPGRAALHAELAGADVLLTSFRPSALARLGLDTAALAARHPRLCTVAIVGSASDPQEPGHDLTYLAAHGLVTGETLPPTLYADMGGALAASEAVLAVLLERARTGRGTHRTVALDETAAWLALPRGWGLTADGAAIGGGHAGYRVYRCADGRVALAALEPHFAARLLAALALPGHLAMDAPTTRDAVAAALAPLSRKRIDALAATHDIPLLTLAP